MAHVRGSLRLLTPEAAAPHAARWPERIRELAKAVRAGSGPARDRARGELWTIVGLTLQRYARSAAGRLGTLDPEEILDVAADKALDLLGRIDKQIWDPAGSTAAEVCAYLASVARHGVIDRLRARRREVRWPGDREEPAAGNTLEARPVTAVTPGTDADAAEHARAIAACARGLTARARRAWFLRVFYEFSSEDIARHPEVASTPAAVNVMLQRCRRAMRTCMARRGLHAAFFPTGTFTILWEMMVKGGPEEPGR